MACDCRSLAELVIRKKSVKAESAGSSWSTRVSSPFLSSQASTAASTILRVSVDAMLPMSAPSLIVRQVSEDWWREKGAGSGCRILTVNRAVKPVVADVVGYAGIDDRCGVGSLLDCSANGAGRRLLGEVGQQVEACFASGLVSQGQEEAVGLRGIAGGHGNAGWEIRCETAQVKAGTRGDDEVAGYQEIGGAMPAADGEE